MIKVENLTKDFGPKRAVDNVSFTVERGEVLGFLGPNGAGKSTTMRMITGFIPPTAGRVTIGGYNVAEQPIKAKQLLGYLPENAPSYHDMTVYGFLNFIAEIRGYAGEAKKKAVNRVVELCFLESVLHQSIDTLSKGFKHRTCLAQAILHDPPVLVLDEPTDGLDPNQKHEVRTLIREMGRNKAIIFSTHILEEVDAACTRAIIIDRGKIVANGTPDQLRKLSKYAGAVTVRLRDVPRATALARLEQIQFASHTSVLEEKEGTITLQIFPKSGGADEQLLKAVSEAVHGWQIELLKVEEGRLDEVFRSITMPDTAPAATSRS